MRKLSIPRPHLPRTFRGQVLLCCCVSALALLPQLSHHGLNGVTRTYLVAAERFWLGISPYSTPTAGTDWFKYSPTFAMLYGVFAKLPHSLHAALWATLGFTAYWLGVARWVLAYRDGRVIWFWLIAASMEMDGSLRYQQINALLTGMILWGVADYRDGKQLNASSLLTTAANWKIFPSPFSLGLLVRRNPQFWVGTAVLGVLLLLLPAFYLGWNLNWEFHRQWFEILRQDSGAGGLLDLETALLAARANPSFAHASRLVVGALTLAFLVDIRKRPLFPPAEALWLCIGLTGILLFNPRTEPPTFVLAGPVLPLLWIASRSLGGAEKKFYRLAIFACFFFLSLVHNDIWPRKFFSMATWYNVDKTFAVLGLWLLTLYLAKRRQ